MNNLFMHGIRVSVVGYCDRCGKQLREFEPGEPVCECKEEVLSEDIESTMKEAVEELNAAMMNAVDAFSQVAQKIIEIYNRVDFEEFRKAYLEMKAKENSNL